eukprot:CAMPEP_0179271126 /NCGR_PEP_ID=MMETSP0797-20121207/31815_1 /TAXON_ID=47934 /ORGANISM="Dinophysis acuminata, Strain DAEP01" /LENGTH=95 /DNA_ID=CAMNT_0020979469 /DNA_START=201 /DNA_END=485 /DNA_ORIENTATION=+
MAPATWAEGVPRVSWAACHEQVLPPIVDDATAEGAFVGLQVAGCGARRRAALALLPEVHGERGGLDDLLAQVALHQHRALAPVVHVHALRCERRV